MSAGAGAIQSAKSLIGRHPAETATATAGAVGLLLWSLVEGDSDGLQTGLVVLLAGLPAVVSYVYNLGKPKRLPHDLGREIEELSLRAARRARLGHEGWNDDVAAATKLATLRPLLAPSTQPSSDPEGGAKEKEAGPK